MSALLRCENLSVGYGGKAVLSDVAFELCPGEVVALLGPNGGGKTTLLKTLSGLIPPKMGTVFIQGEALSSLSAREVARRIGFVPQDEAWQFDFLVEEVVSMGRLPISNGFFDSEEDKAAAEEAMRRAGCLELRTRPITELSGGERQRVLIARALAQETPILFLDEPTAHLDPQFQVGIGAMIRELANSGKTLLVAVHDLPMAATMADRGMLVAQGKVSPPRGIKPLLSSEELDRAYATKFERITTGEGRVVVLPRHSN